MARLHHEVDTLEFGHVLQWVAPDRDQIRGFVRLERADLIRHAEVVGRGDRGGADRFQRGQPRSNQGKRGSAWS
jgi:hypothetical protein